MICIMFIGISIIPSIDAYNIYYTQLAGGPLETQIRIRIPYRWYWKNVHGWITNDGGSPVTNINWTLTISGGLFGGPIESHGIIPELLYCETNLVHSKDVKLEFGRRTIEFVVKVNNEEFSEVFDCFIVGRYIRML